MDKVFQIYYLLCKKYGFDKIAIKYKISSQIEMEKKDEIFTQIENIPIKELIRGVVFINLDTMNEINVGEELNGRQQEG